jgi:hypothetical protein
MLRHLYSDTSPESLRHFKQPVTLLEEWSFRLLISDRLIEGHTIVDQRWNYDDFCNNTIRLEDYTYSLIRQVEVVALVRSFRPIPIDEFDHIAQSLIM